jgi:ribosomal protein L20
LWISLWITRWVAAERVAAVAYSELVTRTGEAAGK